MTTFSTKDYSIFNIHGSNREIRHQYISILKQSISENNLLQYRPILCDSFMNVLDGQHRLEVAKQLQIPIYYEIQKDLSIEEVLAINIQFSWKNEDFFHFFVKEGYPEYLKLKKFIDDFNYNLSEGLTILGQSCTYQHNRLKTFKTGKFIFPDEHMEEIKKKIEKVEMIKTYLKRHSKIMKKHVMQPRFCRAILNFLACKSVSAEVFMNKLQYNLDLMRPCRTIDLYEDLFKNIYNWKNKNKVMDLEEI
jgi:hypothetical protein